jgi:hypothetical protein
LEKVVYLQQESEKGRVGGIWLKDTGRGSWESPWSPTSRVIAEIGKAKNLPRRRGDTENSQGQKIGTPGESKGSQYFQPEGLGIANLAWSDVSS